MRLLPLPAVCRALLPQPLLAPLVGACVRPGLASALTPAGRTTLRQDLAYGPEPRHRLDLYLPAAARAESAPLLVFLYGGAWQQGERGGYAFVARVLAARGLAVAVPDYRLWPEARWPGFVEDAALAVAWLRGPAGRAAGAPAGPVFLMGHSAGGFIAASLALDPHWLDAAALPGGRGVLAGCITLAAPFNWTPRSDPLAAIFAASPGGAIRAAPEEPRLLRGAPPMLLLHGTEDRTVHPAQSERMAVLLAAAGRPVWLRLYAGLGHVGVLAAMAAPVRALGLARAPVLKEVLRFAARGGGDAAGGMSHGGAWAGRTS